MNPVCFPIRKDTFLQITSELHGTLFLVPSIPRHCTLQCRLPASKLELFSSSYGSTGVALPWIQVRVRCRLTTMLPTHTCGEVRSCASSSATPALRLSISLSLAIVNPQQNPISSSLFPVDLIHLYARGG